MDSTCQGCVFQRNVDGCKVGLIDNAKKAGVEVVECWNEEGEFNILRNRVCMFKRPEQWKSKVSPLADKLNLSLQQYAEQEIETKFSAFVICNKESSEKDILNTVNSLANQKLKPNLLCVIREHDNLVRPSNLIPFIKECGFPEWKIQNISDETRRDRLSVELVLRWKPRPYFACFRAGKEVHAEFLSNLNTKITKEFFQFAIINNDDDEVHGVVASKSIVQYYKNQFAGLELIIEKEGKLCQGILNIKQVDPLFQ